jgi:hypothetical protein
MSNKDLSNELLENYDTDTDYERNSINKYEELCNNDISIDIINSILTLKHFFPNNMFYLCLLYNKSISKYIFKIGSTYDIIKKLKELNIKYKSNGDVYLVAFTNLISYVFKKEFMEIFELQKYIIETNIFNVDKKVYDIFLNCCQKDHFKLLNYHNINNIIIK